MKFLKLSPACLIEKFRNLNIAHTRYRSKSTTNLQYVQGQSPSPKIREYFYFIDHQGQLFLDDARMKNFTSCFKEKDFLVFFFKRIKKNITGKYEQEFPFISPCGRERNFVRCNDTPVVFTHITPAPEGSPGNHYRLCYGGAGDSMSVEFRPMDVCMLPDSFRVYHPAPEQYGGIGLIKSSLAIELSKLFEFGDGDGKDMTEYPTHLTWEGKRYTLTNILLDVVKDRKWDPEDGF